MTAKTPAEIAQATLDAHAIKPHWRRDGEQIAALIAEAIEADRAQRSANADMVAATLAALPYAEIFYHSADAGGVGVQFSADSEGRAYVVDVDSDGATRSGWIEFETGFSA